MTGKLTEHQIASFKQDLLDGSSALLGDIGQELLKYDADLQ